jgi:polar amino acid transport system substrate-binding protein/glutamate/aspartate transport system substrate-binding protein
LLATLVALAASPAWAGVLDRVRETGEFRVGFRPDAVPFSYKQDNGRAAGFSVVLCGAVFGALKRELGRDDLEVVEVEVSAAERLDAIADGRIDILCEATTHTLERRQRMDFSIPTFVTGASLAYRADGPSSFEELDGQKVGVLESATISRELEAQLESAGGDVEVVTFASHEAGFAALAAAEITAYFGDGAILLYHWVQSPERDALRVSERILTVEPYALALPKDDPAFRLLVDETLSQLYRTGRIEEIFQRAFGLVEPSEIVRVLWAVSALPD